MIGWRSLRAAALLVAVIVLVGCGPMPESPTATTTTTTVTPPANTGTPPLGSPTAGQLTLGQLAQRVNAAWSGVRSYRITFTGATTGTPVASPVARARATPAATPLARPRETFVSIHEVVFPDQQRQEVRGLGGDDHEAVAVGGRLFIRGPLVQRIAPGTPDDTWVAIDPSTLPEGSVLARLLGGLPQLPGPPLAAVPPRLSPQTLRDLGSVKVDDRTCQVYGAADTVVSSGMRVDYAIAVDDRDLPCSIETSAGGVTQGRTEYSDIDEVAVIEAPAAATPVAVPPALATPAPRD